MRNKPKVTHQIRVGHEYLALIAEAIRRQTLRECRMQSLSGVIESSLGTLLDSSAWLNALDIEEALNWPLGGAFLFHVALNSHAAEQCNDLRSKIRDRLGRAATTTEVFAIAMQWSLTLPIAERAQRASNYWT